MSTFRQISNRLPPKMPTTAYRTYRAISPLSTHFRLATCQEIQCPAYTNGWTYLKTDLEREHLLYAVTHAGKRYREMSLTESGEIYLVFEPGQRCFQADSHRMPLDRPEFYYTGRGDFRSFSIRKAQQLRAEDWVDHFANHVDKLNTKQQEG